MKLFQSIFLSCQNFILLINKQISINKNYKIIYNYQKYQITNLKQVQSKTTYQNSSLDKILFKFNPQSRIILNKIVEITLIFTELYPNKQNQMNIQRKETQLTQMLVTEQREPKQQQKKSQKKKTFQSVLVIKNAKQNSYQLQKQQQRKASEIKQQILQEQIKLTNNAKKVYIYKKQVAKDNNGTPKKQQNRKQYYYSDSDQFYDIWDLTQTFWKSYNLTHHCWLKLPFILLILIRYVTLVILAQILIFRDHSRFSWVIVFGAVKIVFVMIAIKISIKISQTKTDIILKKIWNTLINEDHQHFEIIDIKKVIKLILQTFIIPSQLAFVYLQKQDFTYQNKTNIYSAINFIFLSIQAIIYYPFLIGYSTGFDRRGFYFLNLGNADVNILTLLAIIAFSIMFAISVYLLLIGIKLRYGSFSKICGKG